MSGGAGRSRLRVTVAITNYNYGRFLADAVESALGQTYPEVEVVVVDDGSTDDSRDVIASYGERIIAVLQENAGQGAAYNAAWRQSRGDVVFFLDADDVLKPDAAARAVAVLDQDPATAKVQFRMELVDAARRPIGVTPAPGVLSDGDLREHALRFRNYAWPPNSANAYARFALEQVMPLPADEYRQCPDAFMAETTVLCGPVRSLDDIGVEYRMHGGNEFVGTPVTREWLHAKIRRTVVSHGHVRVLAERLGLDAPDADAGKLLDVAFAGFRLASLKLDPQSHPLPSDRVWRVGVHGVRSALAHPRLRSSEKLKRTAWFCALAPAPRPLARRLLDIYLPDGPRRRSAEHRPGGRSAPGGRPDEMVRSEPPVASSPAATGVERGGPEG